MTATDNQINKVPAPKEKLHSVMEAASALTALCDEDSANGEGAPSSPKITPKETPDTTAAAGTPKDDGSKRFLPDHKKPDAALTFPEKVSYILCCLLLTAIASLVCRYIPIPDASQSSRTEISLAFVLVEEAKVSFCRRICTVLYCRHPTDVLSVFKDKILRFDILIFGIDVDASRFIWERLNFFSHDMFFLSPLFSAHEFDGVCRPTKASILNPVS